MNKLKSLLHKNKGDESQSTPQATQSSQQTSHSQPTNTTSAASSTPAASSAPAATGGEAGEGVVLHTNIGDITIALYRDETPKVQQSTPNTQPMAT